MFPTISSALLLTCLSAAPPSAYEAEIHAWREQRFERLRAADGWVTLTGLTFPEPGTRTIGSAETSDVVLETPNAPALVGVLEVGSESISFEPADDVRATVDGAPIDRVALASDTDEGGPTVVEVGTVSFFVIERGDRLGIRSRDSEHPARRELQPIESWPIDPAWRLVGRFVPHPEGRTIPVPDVLGTVQDVPSPGRVELEIEGRTVAIDAMDGGDGELFLVFGDRTNKTESYGGGRFLYTSPPAADGTVVVDFNRAYNPPCAFTPWATCPLPPPENKLEVAIPAGEKRAGHGAH